MEEAMTTNELLLSSLTGGPFISCGSNIPKEYLLGQFLKQSDLRGGKGDQTRRRGDDEDEEAGPSGQQRSDILAGGASIEELLVAAAAKHPTPQQRSGGGQRKPGGGGAARVADPGPTLKDLVMSGILSTKQNVTLLSNAIVHRASLSKDGAIQFEGQRFNSPSAFSAYVNRAAAPQRPVDLGWTSVQVDDVPLEEWRNRYLARGGVAGEYGPPDEDDYQGSRRAGSGNNRKSSGGARSKAKAAVVVAPVPETQQWVQCSRCETWRVVPDDFWPEIQNAGEDEDWFCEDALWDVESMAPNTPACKRR